MPVVVGMLNLPGCRWREQNGGKDDYRLWHEELYQEQAAAFWRALASRLRDRPPVVAYNLLNEPHPAREAGNDGADAPGFVAGARVAEDAWDRMDYEVGPGPLGAACWEAVENGEHPPRPRSDNPLWRVLQDGLHSER